MARDEKAISARSSEPISALPWSILALAFTHIGPRVIHIGPLSKHDVINTMMS